MKTINTYQKNGFVINQVKYTNPTPHYSIEVTYNDNEITTIDSLDLEASTEAFNEEIKKLHRQYDRQK